MASDISDVIDELEFLKGSLVLVEQTPYRTPHFKKSMLYRGIELYKENLQILEDHGHLEIDDYRVWLMTYMIRTRMMKLPEWLDGVCVPGTTTVVRQRNVQYSSDIGYVAKRSEPR
jgi:hypothetical protein